MKAAQTFVQHSRPFSCAKGCLASCLKSSVVPKVKKVSMFVGLVWFLTLCKPSLKRNSISVTLCLRDCLRSLLEARRLYHGHKFLALKWRKACFNRCKSLKIPQQEEAEERSITCNRLENSTAKMRLLT